MRASWFVVVGAVVSAVTACGGEDQGELFGSGGGAGASSGGSSTGGSGATGGTSSTGGSAGASSGGAAGAGAAPTGGAGGTGGSATGGSGGSATGGTGGGATGGSGGSATGGTGGSATGGSGGSATGGTGGSATGGTGGAATGGTGGSATGGSGGSATGGSGGTGGGCTVKKWCKDSDNDGYGSPLNPTFSCNKPSGGGWIEDGSKAEACGDCADLVKEAFPFSNYCGAVGYQTNTGTSFDYNCDTNENACADYQKAGTCVLDATSGKCTGAGYLPVPGSTAKNPYCGSSQFQDCLAVSVGLDAGGTLACVPSVKTANHLTCK
ncbi:MAG: hypothetical protein IPM35_11870 [Myxococcales bacterium]|nr:hypothetical protein [Myxococcales bacterium]